MFIRKDGEISLFARWKNWLGPLGWGTLLVFVGLRTSDALTLLSRVYLGRHLSVDHFGAIDPIFAFLGIFVLPAAGFFQIAAKSISRFIELRKDNEYRGLLFDMAAVATLGSVVSSLTILCLKSYVLERLRLAPGYYIYVIASLSVIAWWMPFCLAIYQGRRSYYLMIVHYLLISAATLVLTIFFMRTTSLDLLGSLLARVLPGLVTVFILFYLLKPLFSGRIVRDPDELKLMREMFVPINIYLAGLALLLNMAPLFVRNFMVQDSGGYGAVTTLGIIPGHIISSVVFVIFPIAAAEHAAGKEIDRLYKQAMLIGAAITLICVGVFAVISYPLMRMWNSAFVPYAQYVWPYTMVMGLNGMIQVIASVEMARHRYFFLWFLAVPALAMCSVLYGMRNILNMPIIMITLVVTHSLVLLGMWICKSIGNKATVQRAAEA